jgi:hypothetical protein
MKDFEIMLQLHAEEGAAGVAPPSDGGVSAPTTESYSEPTTDSGSGYSSEPSQSADYSGGGAQEQTSQSDSVVASAGGFEIVKDPVTGKRELRSTSSDESDAQAQESYYTGDRVTDSVGVSSPAQQANTAPYTIDEMSRAMASGDVDERRIPEAYLSQYADYKIKEAQREFTRRTEAQQLEQARLEMEMTPENDAEKAQKYYQALDAEARDRAKKLLNLTDDDLEDLEFIDEDKYNLFNDAVANNKVQLQWQIQQQQVRDRAARAAQEQVMNDVRNFVIDAQKREPNFNAIDVMMNTRYQSMPYKDARIVEDALNATRNGTTSPQQAQVLKRYYEETRKAFYASRNGLNTYPTRSNRPPVVESAGNGQSLSNNYRPDFKALRSAKNPKAKTEWLMNYFGNKNR